MNDQEVILNTIANYQDEHYFANYMEGKFFESFPTVILFNKDSNKNYEKTRIHELAHCWHMYGSPVGTIFYLASNNNIYLFSRIIVEAMKENIIIRDGDFISLISNSQLLNDWYKNIKILHLFKNGFYYSAFNEDKGTFPLVKDFIDTCEYFIKPWQRYKNWDVAEESCENLTNTITSTLVDDKCRPTNYVSDYFTGAETIYSPRVNSYVLTPEMVIEDYAILFESIYDYGGLETDSYADICKSLLSPNNLMYGNTFRFFYEHSNHLGIDNYLDLIANYLAYLEVSLMSPFHPSLIFDSSYRYFDFFIPHRFAQVVRSSTKNVHNHINIKSLHSINSQKFLDYLDALSEEMGWGTYREKLRKFHSFFQPNGLYKFHETFVNTNLLAPTTSLFNDVIRYIGDLVQYIMDRKYLAIILDFEALDNMPVMTISESGIFSPFSSNDVTGFTCLEFYSRYISLPLSIDFVFNSSYNKTFQSQESIRHLLPKECSSYIPSFDRTAASFIELNKHIGDHIPFYLNPR